MIDVEQRSGVTVVQLRHGKVNALDLELLRAITAIVVPAPGAHIDERELLRRVRAHLDPYKVPKAVITAEELPRTSTGKIQKNVLRDEYARYYDQPAGA